MRETWDSVQRELREKFTFVPVGQREHSEEGGMHNKKPDSFSKLRRESQTSAGETVAVCLDSGLWSGKLSVVGLALYCMFGAGTKLHKRDVYNGSGVPSWRCARVQTFTPR